MNVVDFTVGQCIVSSSYKTNSQHVIRSTCNLILQVLRAICMVSLTGIRRDACSCRAALLHRDNDIGSIAVACGSAWEQTGSRVLLKRAAYRSRQLTWELTLGIRSGRPTLPSPGSNHNDFQSFTATTITDLATITSVALKDSRSADVELMRSTRSTVRRCS